MPDLKGELRAGEARPAEMRASAPAGANLLFLREEELRSAQDLLFFAYRDFTRAADEVLVASSRRILASVTRIDDAPIGGGAPGPVACCLLDRMREDLRTQIAAAKAR